MLKFLPLFLYRHSFYERHKHKKSLEPFSFNRVPQTQYKTLIINILYIISF